MSRLKLNTTIALHTTHITTTQKIHLFYFQRAKVNLQYFSAWFFEVWVDRERLISRLSLVQAIGTFLHLAFVFNLHYPKVLSLSLFYEFLIVILKGWWDSFWYFSKEVCQVWRQKWWVISLSNINACLTIPESSFWLLLLFQGPRRLERKKQLLAGSVIIWWFWERSCRRVKLTW